jgi:hypothetical protein
MQTPNMQNGDKVDLGMVLRACDWDFVGWQHAILQAEFGRSGTVSPFRVSRSRLWD